MAHANTYDANGNLNINLAAGSITGGNAAASPTGSPVPASADYTGFSDGSGNLLGVSAANPLPITGSISATNPSVGTTGSGTPTSATLAGASDGTNLQGLLVESSSNKNLRVGLYSGANEATVTGANALKVDGSSVTQPVSFSTATSGGCSDYHAVAAASNNAANIKASAGQVYGWSIFNNAAYPVFVKLYNKATTPAPASDTPFKTIGVQAGVTVESSIAAGLAMGTGIGIAIVQGIADNDNTAVAASDCVVDLAWK